MQKSLGKSKIRRLVKSWPIKTSIWNLANVITSRTSFTMQLSGQIGLAGLLPEQGKYNTFVTFRCPVFFSRSCAQVEPSHWFLRWMAQTTWFRRRTVLLEGLDDGWVIRGKYSPKNSPQKAASIGSLKPKLQNLYTPIFPELLIRRTSDLRITFRRRKALRG